MAPDIDYRSWTGPDIGPYHIHRPKNRTWRMPKNRSWRIVLPTGVWGIKCCGGQTCLNWDFGSRGSFSIYKIFRELPFSETRRRPRLLPKKSPRTGLDNWRITWRI